MAIMPILRRTLAYLCRPWKLGLLATALIAAGAWTWWEWPQQFRRRGEAELAARHYDKAREEFSRYLAYRPADARGRLLAARAARHLREYYEAYEHLRRCRDDGGDAEAVDVETALIAIARGKEEPTAELRQRAEQDDELGLAICEVLIQHDLDTYQLWAALHGLTRYLEHRPDDLHARLARAYVWERFLYFTDALYDYRAAVAAQPDSVEARLKLAQTLLIAGTPEEALEQFEWLAERRPEQPAVQFGLARCRRRLGDADAARRLLDALLARTADNGEVLWERGQLELDGGRAAQAEPWLQRAFRASPHDRRIGYSLSRCLLALDRRPDAKAIDARVAAIDADLRRLEQVRAAVMAQPNDAALRCEGGLLFLRNGERQEGLRWLGIALRIDPDCQAARAALAAQPRAP
jgi:tetratricopeptide (TPR) repeat protein